MIQKTPAKIFVFLFITCAVVVGVKTLSVDTPNHAVQSFATLSPHDTSFFFIGSSRVQKGIDPDIVSGDDETTHIFNVGIAGSSFLSNCVAADFLVRQPGYKVLYIELAPLLNELPDGLLELSSELEQSPSHAVLNLTENQPLTERSMMIITIMNQQMFKSISIGHDVRNLIDHKSGAGTEAIGFSPYDKNDSREVASFLTWEEINVSPAISVDLTKYNAMLEYLNKVARDNNSRVIFFLPITSGNPTEKNILIPLYRALPDSMKLAYSDSLLKKMRRPEFLGDKNHLNRKGATEYSRLIRLLLDND